MEEKKRERKTLADKIRAILVKYFYVLHRTKKERKK